MKKLLTILVLSIVLGCSIEGIQAPIKGLDGEDGLNSYVEIQENSPNPGQTTIISWTDYDRDGILDEDEVRDVAIINDGQDGEDGKTTIIETEVIEPGELCSYGGILVRTITDEQETVVFICCCGCEEEKLEVCYYDQETGDLIFMFIPASEVQDLIDNGAFLGSCKDWQYED